LISHAGSFLLSGYPLRGRPYFRLLFFWLAAIFSFAVMGAFFAEGSFPAGAGGIFDSALSGLRLLPFWFAWSFMENLTVQEGKNIP
jgi:hypothetical protein